MTLPDEVGRLVEQLKALPLIDGADLDQPFAAYDSFELVVSAILRAALVQVPEGERKKQNAELFRRFVRNHFPENRGRDDTGYANQLWTFRCECVKEKRTGPFALINGVPDAHLLPAADGRPTLNLESLIADFRDAVDDLAEILRASVEMRQLAADELARRTVSIAPMNDRSPATSFTRSPTVLGRSSLSARSASATN